jgi:hypothetical protein
MREKWTPLQIVVGMDDSVRDISRGGGGREFEKEKHSFAQPFALLLSSLLLLFLRGKTHTQTYTFHKVVQLQSPVVYDTLLNLDDAWP